MLGTKEHYEMIENFDRFHKFLRLEKEPKNLWSKGVVYQDGHTNEKFKFFLAGYALAKSIYQ